MKKNLYNLVLMTSKYSIFGLLLQIMLLQLVLASGSNAQQKIQSVKEVIIEIGFEEARLPEVFAKIEDITNYRFFFHKSDFDQNFRFNLNPQEITVGDILLKISREAQVSFKQLNENISLKKIPGNSSGENELEVIIQTRNVSGKVISLEDDEGLPGVNVVEKGTSNGTVTDLNGNYQLTVSEGATLVFSSVGFTTEEIAVGNQAVIDLSMAPDIQQLQELVVVGYGSVRKGDLTGSVGSVDMDQAAAAPVPSVGQALQGRVPGVQVTQNSGAPGSDFTIRIRGGNSMQGGNDPLYVLDGFPVVGNVLNMLNIDEIESIDILKDASATAIYGARGANGVVMITTKKGSRDRSVLEIDAYYGFQEAAKQVPLMNASQYAQMVNDWAEQEDLSIPYPDLNNLPYDTDWQEEVFRTSPIQNYSVSYSGGNDKTRYALSGNILDQKGIIRSSDFNRGSLRASLTSEITPRLLLANQLLVANLERNEVPSGILQNAFIAPPTIPVYDEDGNYYDYSELPWWGAFPRNPVADANEITNHQSTFRIVENLSAEYTIVEGLTVKSSWGVDFSNSTTDFYATRLHESGGDGGRAENRWYKERVYLNENTLNLNQKFGTDHNFNATAGFTWQRSEERGLSVEGRGFVSDLLKNNIVGSAEEVSPPETIRQDWTLLSWLGRVNYIFADRYLVTATIRADGSSRFGEGNKWGVFPSAALAWRISNEPFLQNSSSFSDLKLRLSWGVTGNQEIGVFNSLQRIAPVSYVDGDQLRTGYAPISIANPDLRWEETEQFNAGLDIGLWEQKVTFSADYYVKNTSDLLALVNLPTSSGFNTMLRNVGEIRNSGLELGLGFTPIQNSNFTWQIDANASFNRNEVVRLARGDDFLAPRIALLGSIHLVSEGEPLSVFYGFNQTGLDDSGNPTYEDRNNDGDITDEDRTILGSPYPDLVYGFNSNLRYKNFDLSILFQGVTGNEIYNYALGLSAASLAKGYNQITDVHQNYWTADNRYPNPKYPRLNTGGYDRPSSRFIEDGSFLRLSTVRLGYNFNKSNFNWLGDHELMLYLSGQNLFTVTGYSWYDPEVNTYGSSDLRPGVDIFTYPQARTITMGFQFRL
jgi:TonB-linked SusC/RagA family outer membrane protein